MYLPSLIKKVPSALVPLRVVVKVVSSKITEYTKHNTSKTAISIFITRIQKTSFDEAQEYFGWVRTTLKEILIRRRVS